MRCVKGLSFRLVGLIWIGQMIGCQSFSSYPDRVIADYGNSVHSLVERSVYNGYKSEHPETYAPDGMEGQKATAGYQRVYQGDLGSPQKVRSPAVLGITGSAGSAN